jgi:arsenate reductase-like glutaredoxin family protein
LQGGISFSERDFFKEPFTETELRELTELGSVSDMFSWRSPTAKKLGMYPGELDEADLIKLMLSEPRLIRRPIIKIETEIIIGPSFEELAKL